MDNRRILGMQIVEEVMMNFRKAARTRSSMLVWASLSLSSIGRYGFDRGTVQQGFLSAGVAALAAATILPIFDMRKGNRLCVIGR
jgi:hypothetical protein